MLFAVLAPPKSKPIACCESAFEFLGPIINPPLAYPMLLVPSLFLPLLRSIFALQMHNGVYIYIYVYVYIYIHSRVLAQTKLREHIPSLSLWVWRSQGSAVPRYELRDGQLLPEVVDCGLAPKLLRGRMGSARRKLSCSMTIYTCMYVYMYIHTYVCVCTLSYQTSTHKKKTHTPKKKLIYIWVDMCVTCALVSGAVLRAQWYGPRTPELLHTHCYGPQPLHPGENNLNQPPKT